jgi:hypothetical protein
MTPPLRLFARPLLGDLLRALGLAVLAAGVLSLPFWLPTALLRWVVPALAFLALWFLAFLVLRFVHADRQFRREMAAWRDQDAP